MGPPPIPESGTVGNEPRETKALRAGILARVSGTLGSALPWFSRDAGNHAVLIGFSGGVDSTVLLHLLREATVTRGKAHGPLLIAAHLDHRLRPDSEDQARFAEAVARSLGIEFVSGRRDVARRARRERRSLEEAGRIERFGFFAEIVRERRLSAVVLGHTRTDQAETLLLRLARGSGGLGLGAMAPAREDERGLLIVRPLLSVSRAEVSALARAEGWRCYEDPSNAGQEFARNRIRRRVLPLLRETVNPQAEAALARAAEVLREDEAWLGAEAGRRFAEVAEVLKRGDATEVRIPAADLRGAHPALARRLLREGLRAVRGHLRRIGLVHIEAALRILRTGRGAASLDLPGASLRLERGVVAISGARRRRSSPDGEFPSGGGGPSPPDPEAPFSDPEGRTYL